MSKSKTQPGGLQDVMANPFAAPDVGARAQALWSAQGAAFEHMRDFLDGWYARRRDAAASAAECCTQLMSEGGDLSSAARVWTAWASGSMERLRDDVHAQTALATQIASEMTGAFSANGATKHHRRKAPAEPAPESNGARAKSLSADVR